MTTTTMNTSLGTPQKEYLTRCSSSSDTSVTNSVTTTSSTSSTWLDSVEQHIRQALSQRDQEQPLLVGICGIPGSGKSVSSHLLHQALQDVGCATFPMDGYHYRREQLTPDMMWRRGAPDTFDADCLMHDLRRIRYGTDARIALPGFDHADGDPRPNQHEFCRAQHRVVLCEGLYVLHETDGFESLSSLLDWTLFVDAPLDTCLNRLKERNRCIPDYENDAARLGRRVDVVDRVNAELVQKTQHRANFIVPVEEVMATQ